MTVVAMWCRHLGDNVIGIGGSIPWSVESDAKHFFEVVRGETVVCGRKTYETFSQKMLENCKIFVFTKNGAYETADSERHFIVSSQKELVDAVADEADIYIAGGAMIYDLFMRGKERFKPQVIVDCLYEGEMEKVLGEKADIGGLLELVEKNYRRISPFYCQDNVKSAIYLKKGEFVEQKVLKRIVEILEKNAFLA